MPAIFLHGQMMASVGVGVGVVGGTAPNKRVVGDPHVKLSPDRVAGPANSEGWRQTGRTVWNQKQQHLHPADFYYQRFRFSLRFRFGCGEPADLTGSCRTVGSPFPPPRLATIDCAISTAKAASRFSTGFRLHMHLPYGGGYAGRAQLSCNTFESHPDLTNLFAARKGQVAVALTVPLAGILLAAITPGSRPGATRTTSSRNARDKAYPEQYPSKSRQISVTYPCSSPSAIQHRSHTKLVIVLKQKARHVTKPPSK